MDLSGRARRQHEAEIAKRLEQTSAALARLSEQIEHLTKRVDKIDRTQIAALQQAAGILERNTRRQTGLVERLRRATGRELEQEFVRDRVLQRLLRIAHSDEPFVVGPWTGEVGFELLYWAPFVRWVLRKFNIDPSRVTLVSRGGTAGWYGQVGRYVDILDLVTAEQFKESTQGVRKKQRWMRQFDRNLVRRVAGVQRPVVLHPSLMYALFLPYWALEASHRWIEQFTDFELLAPPSVPGLERLPSSYVAARFYFSDCFPDTPENRTFAAALLRAAAAHSDVVVLSSGVKVDDHVELPVGAADRIHRVDDAMSPETNLAVQTAVIARAKGFIGTYGGFAYLAPFCGVNALAVYSRPTYYVNHLGLATTAFERIGGGSLTVADVTTLRQAGLAAVIAAG